MDWTQIVAVGVPVLLGIGFVWNKVEKVTIALKELAEALLVLVDSVKDKDITVEEINNIKAEFTQAVEAIKNIVKK